MRCRIWGGGFAVQTCARVVEEAEGRSEPLEDCVVDRGPGVRGEGEVGGCGGFGAR